MDSAAGTAAREATPASVSVVVPVYRSEASLRALVARLQAVLDAHPAPAEIILVNDDSPDSCWGLIAELAAADPRVREAIEIARTDLDYTRITAPMAGTVLAIVSQEGQTVNANQSAPTILSIADLTVMTVEADVSEADVAMMDSRLSGPDASLNAPVTDDSGASDRMDFLVSDAPLPDEVAGEAIDVDALTGGFNLQIAFSTGALAGHSAAQYVQE